MSLTNPNLNRGASRLFIDSQHLATVGKNDLRANRRTPVQGGERGEIGNYPRSRRVRRTRSDRYQAERAENGDGKQTRDREQPRTPVLRVKPRFSRQRGSERRKPQLGRRQGS